MKNFITKILTLLGLFLCLGATPSWAEDEYYLVGESFGWGTEAPMYQFKKQVGNNDYELFLQKLPNGTQYKIIKKNGSSVTYYGAWGDNDGYVLDLKTDYGVATPGKNFKFPNSNENNNVYIYFNVVGKEDKPVIYIANDKETSASLPNSLFVQGNVNGIDWTTSRGLEMLQSSKGIFEINDVVVDYGEDGYGYLNFTEFKPIINTWDLVGIRCYAPSYNHLIDCSNGAQTANVKMGNGGDSYKLKAGIYDIKVDLNTKEVTFTPDYPDNLYLYGDLKEGSWADSDHYSAVSNNGIYTFNNVCVNGGANSDPEADYLAFFANIAHNTNDEINWDNMLPRFGCDPNTSTGGIVSRKGTNLYIDNPYTAVTVPIVAYNKNFGDDAPNFQLNDGYYDIVVNLNDYTVSFLKKKEIELTWNINGELKIGQHSGTTKENNLFKLKVSGDEASDVENAHPFITVTAVKNTRDAISEDVTIDNENNVITINKPGVYTLNASLAPEGHTYYAINEPLLVATIEAFELAPQVGEASQAFNADGANVFEGLISFNSEVTYRTDFTVTVTPETEGWKEASNSNNLEDSYREAFGDSDAGLLEQIIGSASGEETSYGGIGIDSRFDGFYTEISSDDIDVQYLNDANDTYNYSFSVKVPCSGKYKVTVVPTDNTTLAEGSNAQGTISVYPNLYAVFGNATKAFNINGYMWAQTDGKYVITVPENENLTNSIGFIPGTYFASSLTTNVNENNFDSTQVYRTAVMNLSAFTADTQLLVTIEKNGAKSDPFVFYIIKGTVDDSNVSTGIEGIAPEANGEAVFYNLQGVRVENPQHGIFIRVANGKSEKVVL